MRTLPWLLLAAVAFVGCGEETSSAADPDPQQAVPAPPEAPAEREQPASDGPTELAGDRGEDLRYCSDPRPEMCTQQYDPVCALLAEPGACENPPCPQSDRWVERPNACEACSEEAVVGYRPGPCDDSGADRPDADRPDAARPDAARPKTRIDL